MGAAVTCAVASLHYLCDEDDDWQPDLADIRSKITNTRGIVVINPNNPTGAVYSPEMQKALIKLLGNTIGGICRRDLRQNFIRRSGVHSAGVLRGRSAVHDVQRAVQVLSRGGFRTGWMIVSGARERAADFIEG